MTSEILSDLPASVREKATDIGLPTSKDAEEALYEELHDWGSERLEGTIQELKGFYVKTGQVISTRVDLVSPDPDAALERVESRPSVPSLPHCARWKTV